jgi:hypothetical protein
LDFLPPGLDLGRGADEKDSTMGALLIGALGVSALALSGCISVDVDATEAASTGGAALKTVAALDCPTTEGALTRTAQAADGRSCDYEGPVGEHVRLRLVALDGRSATEAMAPTKAELRSLVALSIPPVPPADPHALGDHTNIDLPFFHIHTAGDHAEVHMFGVHVQSQGDYADVQTGRGSKHTVVHAAPGGAEVIAEDVGRTNASLVYVLSSDRKTPSGYAAVGYVAKGPAAGPLVVGEFRVAHKDGHHDGGHNDVGRLIDRNVKG